MIHQDEHTQKTVEVIPLMNYRSPFVTPRRENPTTRDIGFCVTGVFLDFHDSKATR